MSSLNDSSMTIYEALQHIQEGKYVMPAFQRQFVWSMAQIEKLWDSILLDYPISTFLFWHIDDSNVTWDTYFCNFRSKIIFNSKKQNDGADYELSMVNTKLTDTAILDGQQRLTSLFLSLYGDAQIRPSYARKKTGSVTITKLFIELDRHRIAVDEEEYNSKKYDIRYSDKAGRQSPTQFELRNILSPKFQDEETREQAIEEAIAKVPSDSKDYARGILNKLYEKIFVEKLIRYTEINDMKQDDALEMFVRFNSGGKPLRKADITLSILEAYWPSAKAEIGKLLSGAYMGFGSDFIIRMALMLYGDVVKSNINKKIAEDLKNNWSAFKMSLNNLESLLADLRIDLSRFSGSWNVLLPIVYFIYFKPDSFVKYKEAIRAYLVRAICFSYFQSGTTGKLQQMKKAINENNFEFTVEMLDGMGELEVTQGRVEDILNAEKSGRVAGEALYYLGLDWINLAFKYELDHLHPDSRFDETKPIPVSAEAWLRWRTLRNRLPNLQLLEGRSNGSKSDMSLISYYNDMNEQQQMLFREQAMIPDGVSMELQDFEEFYNARKALITEKLYRLMGV